ncbi:hypothetical protein [Aureimonas frigidaquae]|uniref:Uncharacterized protein n=1 Tax=Aureimonas frigidaquae TaxID=424757 RepID=A0A0P0Z3S3_9HYPH|nr:hypothetical protein [Aureimonas frigidaquae]BAT28456.1 hypothetical protein [Aureimonas frigidaquae]
MIQGLLPGKNMLIDAIDQRSVKIEEEDGVHAHGMLLCCRSKDDPLNIVPQARVTNSCDEPPLYDAPMNGYGVGTGHLDPDVMPFEDPQRGDARRCRA